MIVYFSTKSHSNLCPFFDSMMSMILNCMISHAFIVWVKEVIGTCLLGEIVGVFVFIFMLVVFRMVVSFVIVLANRLFLC